MKLNRPKYYNIKPGEFPLGSDPRFDTVELKYDGWWGQLVLEGSCWQIYSRTGMLKKEGKLRTSIERTVLHSEYCYGTEWSKDRPTYYDKLALFGAEMLDGVDITHSPLRDVRSMLQDVVQHLRGEEIRQGVFVVTAWPLADARKVWDQNPDFEGLVFKDSTLPWGAPFGRMKREVTMDYICLGFEESDSDRHASWGVASVLGGLTTGTGVVQACKVSGLNDVQRTAFYTHPESFVGRVFEASGKRISKKGALRHPNFVRWRDDKEPSDCMWPVDRQTT